MSKITSEIRTKKTTRAAIMGDIVSYRGINNQVIVGKVQGYSGNSHLDIEIYHPSLRFGAIVQKLKGEVTLFEGTLILHITH